jgi:hypothetical protein
MVQKYAKMLVLFQLVPASNLKKCLNLRELNGLVGFQKSNQTHVKTTLNDINLKSNTSARHRAIR